MSDPHLPVFIWPAPGSGSGAARDFPCPQCGDPGAKRLLVTVAWHTADNPRRQNDVLACESCGAAFYDTLVPPDYADANMAAAGRAEFFLQQGTGLWQSAGLLARIPRARGARYLEIGCGLGFGLDFAIHGLGWQGAGFDPSPIAGIGQSRLKLPIAPEYFTGAAAESVDIALAAEVIEHVASPVDLLGRLVRALAPDGVLLLTTPDAAAIRPETSSGALVPLLSPGLHLILQTERSLRWLLHRSGLNHVLVEHDACSLIVCAARTPLRLIENRNSARALYRAWLVGRAQTMQSDRGLFFAFAGHAFSEAMNDADGAAAAGLVPALAARLSRDFAIELDRPLPLPPATATASLEELADLMPLNLPAILIARAMLRLQGGERRVRVRPLFVAAGEAAAALRRALAERMLEDGETEDLGWVAAAETLLSDAEAGVADLPSRVARLPPAPGAAKGLDRRRDIVRRAFTGAVNSQCIPLARAVSEAEGLREEAQHLLGTARLRPSERDMLFGFGVVELAERGDPAFGRACFARVRAALMTEGGAASDLLWASLRGEALAVERQEGADAARALLASELAALGPAAAGAPSDLARRAAS